MSDMNDLATATSALADPATSAADLAVIAQASDVRCDPSPAVPCPSPTAVPSATTSGVPYLAINEFDIEESADPWSHVMWDKKKNPIAEAQDNGIPKPLTIEDVNLSSGDQVLLNTRVASLAYVTDSRVILCCKTWKESVFAAVSVVKWAFKRHSVIGGQIRYEWLSTIGYAKKKAPFPRNYVILTFSDESGSEYSTKLSFPIVIGKKTPSSQDIAHEILQKACAYRLGLHDGKSADELAFYQGHASSPAIPPNPDVKELSIIALPRPYPAPTGRELRG